MSIVPGAPVPLTEPDKKRLAGEIDGFLTEALAEHAAQVEEPIEEWDRLYLARPRQAKKTFPWDGAANLVIPVIGFTADSIVARIVNTIFSVEPFWTVRPLHKQFVPVARPVQDFLEWSRRQEFDLYAPVKSWVIEVVKYGWGWLKPRWEVKTQPYYAPTATGTPEARFFVKRRAVVDHVLNVDVIAPPGVEDENEASWLAHRFRISDGEVRWRWADGMYEGDLKAILRNKEDTSRVEQTLDAERGRPAESFNTFYELYADLSPTRNEEREEDPRNLPVPMMLTYHAPTKQIVRAVYNPDYLGQRPLMKGTFIEREGRRRGLGICQMLAPLQEEISTLHNQQVDNATLANTRFFVGKRNAVRAGTKVHPGKVMLVGDIERDIKVLQLGDIYPSMRTLEVSALSYVERRSGVSDPQLGRESQSLGNRATATGTLALIQEGNRRFDLNVRDMRDVLGQLGTRLLQLNQQFRPKGVAYFVQGEDGALTEATLDLPMEFVAHRMGVELTASTATINREVEKQSLLAFMGILTQYTDRLLALGQFALNPQLAQVAPEMQALYRQVAASHKTFMDRVAHQFDQKDADTLIPSLEEANGFGSSILSSLGAAPGRAPLGAAPPALAGPGAGGVVGGGASPLLGEEMGDAQVAGLGA